MIYNFLKRNTVRITVSLLTITLISAVIQDSRVLYVITFTLFLFLFVAICLLNVLTDICPDCNENIKPYGKCNYCPNCGARLKVIKYKY